MSGYDCGCAESQVGLIVTPSRSQKVFVFVVVLLAPLMLRAQDPPLEVVLARAAAYVANFRSQLSGIVSEERYLQDARTGRSGGTSQFPPYERQRAVLRSDFLLVRLPGVDRHVEFRDVFEFNGRPTRDRDDRLARLFLNPSASSIAQARSIVMESARYNVGLIYRTLNTPTLALLFLTPTFQERSTFTRLDSATEPSLEFAEGMSRAEHQFWVLEFEEASRPTLIRGEGRKDLPARGRFWVDPVDGRVVTTELIVKDETVEATVDVRYRFDAKVGHLVPVEMRELYLGPDGLRVEGTATYSNFRRFMVEVEEGLPPEVDEPPIRN